MVPLLYLKNYDPSTFEPLVLHVDLLTRLTFLGLLEKPACCQNISRLKLTLAEQEPR